MHREREVLPREEEGVILFAEPEEAPAPSLELVPRRPVLRYHGGKFRDRWRIIACFHPHAVYTEGCGGGASVLLAKPRPASNCDGEVYNDKDGKIVRLFRTLRDTLGSGQHRSPLPQPTRGRPCGRNPSVAGNADYLCSPAHTSQA